MTSFTRELYARDPAAAEAFRRAQDFDQRLSYGKAVTLACFTPATHGLRPMYNRKDLCEGCDGNPSFPCCRHGMGRGGLR